MKVFSWVGQKDGKTVNLYVAAKSKAQVARLMGDASGSRFLNISETGNEAAIAAATASPEVVLCDATPAGKGYGKVYAPYFGEVNVEAVAAEALHAAQIAREKAHGAVCFDTTHGTPARLEALKVYAAAAQKEAEAAAVYVALLESKK